METWLLDFIDVRFRQILSGFLWTDLSMSALRKRRDTLGVMAEMLQIAKEGVGKTHIMYGANLSFTQLTNHLSILLENDLLESVSSAPPFYKTSRKGLRFLQIHHELVKLLRYGDHPTAIKSLRLNKNGSRITVSW